MSAPITPGLLNAVRMHSANERNWFIVRDQTRAVKKYRRPSKVDERRREARRTCRVCFYLRGSMIAGQAFTDYKCSICGNDETHHCTAVPAACATCSDVYRVCQQCYANRDTGVEMIR